ncbi:MAG: DNA recombination protein RmuC [Anaerolineaceae bacterium]|nr:DNA recombination protein RmuC [Anaerolineaceae bacterium]
MSEMELILSITIFVLVLFLLAGFGIFIYYFILRKNSGKDDSPIYTELRYLVDRISLLEHTQEKISQQMDGVGTRLTETGTMTRNLYHSSSLIQQGLSQTQASLSAIQGQAKARQDIEIKTAESIHRLEAVIAGTHSKGAAGENIIDIVFSQLPVEWQVRNFPIDNKVVEFGLRLPNKRILPIDSKWAATSLLEKFHATEDIEERQSIKSQIERQVITKAREVRKYLDPNFTASFGVAAVPDAVFDLCSHAQVSIMKMDVVLISYSMFIPYLLLVFQSILENNQEVDFQQLDLYLQSTKSYLNALQNELDGRFSKAIIMLGNTRDDMKVQVGKLSSGINSIKVQSQITNRTSDSEDV